MDRRGDLVNLASWAAIAVALLDRPRPRTIRLGAPRGQAPFLAQPAATQSRKAKKRRAQKAARLARRIHA
jgi:hypothetical protein